MSLSKEEARVVYLAGFLGYMQDESSFVDIGSENERESIIKSLNILVSRIKMSNEKLTKIHNKVKTGKIKIVVTTPEITEQQKRKALASQIDVNLEGLFNVAEVAIENTCKNCTRQRSKCNLRKSLLKCKIPWVNDGKGKCQYNIEQE